MEERCLVLQTVKNENKLCCIESVGDRLLLPAKTEFGGKEHFHICCGTCKQSLYGRQSYISDMSGPRWNKNEGSLHHQVHMFPAAFYYLGLRIQSGYQSRPLLLNSIENERHRFHHSMPRTLSFSV